MIVLITGASDGLGRALAAIYAARGATVLGVGRRSYAEISDPPFAAEQYIHLDLAEPGAPAVLRAALDARAIRQLDLLIHNAGMGAFGLPAEAAAATTRALLTLNLRVPIALTQALLPLVLPARGTIVFVSSVAAALATPRYAVYTASKVALEGFARSLRVELGRNARVLVLRPGAIRTAFHARSGIPPGALATQRFPPAERVARAMVAAIDRGRPLSTIGRLNRLVAFAGRRFGRLIDRLG